MTCRPEYVKESSDPKEVVACIEERFGEDVQNLELREYKGGLEDAVQYHLLWLKVSRERFLELVDALREFDFLHFQIISGNDDGDVVTLNYHVALFREAGKGKRLGACVSVEVPKTDLVMPSLWERIPGVEYSEREMREMLGIDFDGLPNKALVFLPEDWNEDIKPWRRDETGPSEADVRELS
jgi:membrane-bound hydrogenase subunit beta